MKAQASKRILLALQQGAADGIDSISGTNEVTPPAGIEGWKYYVAMSDTTFDTFTDNGDIPSVISITITAGNWVSANGLFTSITLSSGDGIGIRG